METEAKDTCFCRVAADSVQESGRWALRALALGKDALHAADFAADSTAGHRLEVRAAPQRLRAEFLGVQGEEAENRGELRGRQDRGGMRAVGRAAASGN